MEKVKSRARSSTLSTVQKLEIERLDKELCLLEEKKALALDENNTELYAQICAQIDEIEMKALKTPAIKRELDKRRLLREAAREREFGDVDAEERAWYYEVKSQGIEIEDRRDEDGNGSYTVLNEDGSGHVIFFEDGEAVSTCKMKDHMLDGPEISCDKEHTVIRQWKKGKEVPVPVRRSCPNRGVGR